MQKELSDNLFPVVGVGASAGGLIAFKSFISAIPEQSGMAYILVQHLQRDHRSKLAEILQRETKIPIHEVTNNVKVQPDNIYIIPVNKMLIANDGVLELTPRPPGSQPNTAIDLFFESLAEVHGTHAIGVVLSGTGTDGTLGLKTIKSHGGRTFAQDLDSAESDGMPTSAINAQVVDYILPPEQIPVVLLRLHREGDTAAALQQSPTRDAGEKRTSDEILRLIKKQAGLDFAFYKPASFQRRVMRRIRAGKKQNYLNYVEYLKDNKSEMDTLIDSLLHPVGHFFDKPATFEYLSKVFFPGLILKTPPSIPIRIWIAGCSTGEEAYSMAMSLQELMPDQDELKFQIFATDISEQAIRKARMGVYTSREIVGVSELRLKRFFEQTNQGFQVRKKLRETCVFAQHNFLKDPPFANLDLVCCRNVLIYFEPFLQQKSLATFHYSLKEEGSLLLGNSEAIIFNGLFRFLEKEVKIFTRQGISGKAKNFDWQRNAFSNGQSYPLSFQKTGKASYQVEAENILLSKYTPPGVIINEQWNIVEFRGATSDFLAPSQGAASLNILKMAKEEVVVLLSIALHECKTTKRPVSKNGVVVNNQSQSVGVVVIPLLESADEHSLVLFSKTWVGLKEIPTKHSLSEIPAENENEERIHHLEAELSRAIQDVQEVNDTQSAANEELQSINEELLSNSEELQTVNEEMETSKEELQSTNQELVTVNQELFIRNEQLNQAKLYAEAIVSTIHEPILILNRDFDIINANKSFYRTFSITEDESLGNGLFDVQRKGWDIPGFRDQLLQLQKKTDGFMEWEVTYAFPSVGKRSICFNAQPIERQNGEYWILLAFNDITVWKELERVEKKNADDLKNILEALPQITSITSPRGEDTYFNKFFLEYSGMSLDESLRSGWDFVTEPDKHAEINALWSKSLATGKGFSMEMRLRRQSDNMLRWHLCRGSAIKNEEGVITSWVRAAIDIHEQKTNEQAKDEFIGIASHELKTPLTSAKAYVELVKMSMEKAAHPDLLYITKAGESINRLNNLIGELLDVNKIKNGKLDLRITTFNFNEMISSAIEAIQLSSPHHKIILINELAHDISGDRDRLEQVLLNLLTNAIKYSPDGKEVTVKVFEENSHMTVSVKDNGIGVLKENVSKIFELYYREEDRAIHFQGLGIGLAISQEIIHRHHGRIWVESGPLDGSTFFFSIPI